MSSQSAVGAKKRKISNENAQTSTKNAPGIHNMMANVMACGHSCETQKNLKKTPPRKMAGIPPIRITFKNQEKQAECAPPLPPPLHTPRGDTESTQHADDYKGNTSQNLQAFLPKNKISKIKKIRQVPAHKEKCVPPPSGLETNARTCFPTGGPSSKTYIYIYIYMYTRFAYGTLRCL